VTALYRIGTGLDGTVRAGQLTLLMERPLGVKEVINPLPSSGADDPELLADARRNAPNTVLTLDRIVSLQDYEDFVRAYPGIGKAEVALLWQGEQQILHLTVALADGTTPTATNATVKELRAAINSARHSLRPTVVEGYNARPFAVTAIVYVKPDHVAELVLSDVSETLLERFAFASREFGDDVTSVEVIAAIQDVSGVEYVDLESLRFSGTGGEDAVNGRLASRTAWVDTDGRLHPADLLTLGAADIHLTSTAP
jgi:predicted phage baseplate assembly protein